MSANLTIPQVIKPVLVNASAGNAVACDVISCKNLNKVVFFVSEIGANDTDLVLSLYEATDVAAGTNQAITKTCPIFTAHNMGTTSDAWTRQTDGYTYTIDPATMNPGVVIIEWDPAKHSAGYDCVYLADSGGHASNTVQIWAFCYMKDQTQAANLASVIID